MPELLLREHQLFADRRDKFFGAGRKTTIENLLKNANLIDALEIISFTPWIMYRITFKSEEQKTAFSLVIPLTSAHLGLLHSGASSKIN